MLERDRSRSVRAEKINKQNGPAAFAADPSIERGCYQYQQRNRDRHRWIQRRRRHCAFSTALNASADEPTAAPLAGAAWDAGMLKRPKNTAISVATTILCIRSVSHSC